MFDEMLGGGSPTKFLVVADEISEGSPTIFWRSLTIFLTKFLGVADEIFGGRRRNFWGSPTKFLTKCPGVADKIAVPKHVNRCHLGGGIPKPHKYNTKTSQESLDVLVFQAHWRPWTAPMPSTLGALARRFENHFGRQPEQKSQPEV